MCLSCYRTKHRSGWPHCASVGLCFLVFFKENSLFHDPQVRLGRFFAHSWLKTGCCAVVLPLQTCFHRFITPTHPLTLPPGAQWSSFCALSSQNVFVVHPRCNVNYRMTIRLIIKIAYFPLIFPTLFYFTTFLQWRVLMLSLFRLTSLWWIWGVCCENYLAK